MPMHQSLKMLLRTPEKAQPDKEETDCLTKVQEPIGVERDGDKISDEIICGGQRNNPHREPKNK